MSSLIDTITTQILPGIAFISVSIAVVLFVRWIWKIQGEMIKKEEATEAIVTKKIESLNLEQYNTNDFTKRSFFLYEMLRIYENNQKILIDYALSHRNWRETMDGQAYERIILRIQYKILEFSYDCYKQDFDQFDIKDKKLYEKFFFKIMVGLSCVTINEMDEFLIEDVSNRISHGGNLLKLIYILFSDELKVDKSKEIQEAGYELEKLSAKLLVIFNSSFINQNRPLFIKAMQQGRYQKGSLTMMHDKYVEVFKSYIECLNIYYNNKNK